MVKTYQPDRFYGFLLKGELRPAIDYLKEFPGQREEYAKYYRLFEEGEYLPCPVGGILRQILDVYQLYYREVFFLSLDHGEAVRNLTDRLLLLFDSGACPKTPDRAEEMVRAAFADAGYQILCGKTSGFYGPYIWKTTESVTYEVELPGCIQHYTVKFLRDFLSKSWLDYISFGKIGTGGWTDGDGIINCVRESYDPESERFQVSLLKHEAQHANDLAKYPGMSSADLEYRAKLVELIYSSNPGLLRQFIHEADATQEANGHGLAAARIAGAYPRNDCTLAEIQSTARRLFSQSSEEIAEKYG